MPAKFAKKLSASSSKDLVEEDTPPSKKAKAKETPKKEEPKKKRAKKEGPYTCYREQGSIPEPSLPRRGAVPSKKASFTMLAWNVGGLRSFLSQRVGDLQEAVRLSSPQVLGIMEHKLTEGKPDSEAALKELTVALPEYEVACVNYSTAKKGYSGALVLLHQSCKPLSIVAEDLPSAANEGRMVVMSFDSFHAVLCYVPNSGDGLKRLSERIEQWDVQLRERLQSLSATKPVVLMGDLNVAHQDKDNWNVEAPHVPKSAGTTAEERESFGKLLDCGFKDSFSVRHPEAFGAFTYWSVRAGNRKSNRGLRLDYALVSEALVSDQETSAGTWLWDAFHLPSVATGDHCPVGVTLAVDPSASE